MQTLRSANPLCADCYHTPVLFVDLFHSVFLCADCAAIHAEFRVPVRSLDGDFTSEETTRIVSAGGNQSVNHRLLRGVKPWFPSIQEYPYPAVRRGWIKAKYWQLTFSEAEAATAVRYNLNEFWFHLDEDTDEVTQVQGPFTRTELLTTLGATIRPETYVWHPAISKNWLPIEKLDKRLLDQGEVDLEQVYQACEVRRKMEKQDPPHLKGVLDWINKGKPMRRWVMLVNTSLYIANLGQTLQVETAYSLQDLTIYLTLKDERLYIHFLTATDDFSLYSPNSDELLEWFTAIRCAKYMLDILGEGDFPNIALDVTEQHICNVRNSLGFMGKKVKEGMLRKEGSNWKTVKSRWFVLRTQGLYYYKNMEDKAYLGQLPLKGGRLICDAYKYPNHIGVCTGSKLLHIWTEDAAERESWSQALQSVIDQATSESASH